MIFDESTIVQKTKKLVGNIKKISCIDRFNEN